jgi:hypothetical protein
LFFKQNNEYDEKGFVGGVIPLDFRTSLGITSYEFSSPFRIEMTLSRATSFFYRVKWFISRPTKVLKEEASSHRFLGC